MAKSRSDMAKKKDILSFWAEKLISEPYNKFYLDVQFEEGLKEYERTCICFACGSETGTERSHIVPVCNGGTNKVDNLHLLCKECHLESESLDEEHIYFEWLKSKNQQNSGSGLRIRNKANFILELLESGKKELIPKNILEILPKNILEKY